MNIVKVSKENRLEINNFIREQWYTTEMAVRGQLFDMTHMDGFAAYEKLAIVGLVTYRLDGRDCEIMSLDSLKEKRGIGSALVDIVIRTARELHCERVKLITTNDNLNAMQFYQKRGFDMVCLYRNALEAARRLKPEIPLVGDYGIPLRHEIEFERMLTPQENEFSAEHRHAVLPDVMTGIEM